MTAIVCHASSVLLEVTLSDGSLLVAGKTWTGFADSEEDFAVRDRLLVTGQQQYSGRAAARLVVEALGV